ncbi:MAG TPA: DUF4302 domain-containing protein [Petrimonas sp.]|uniref:DUF4302 domain-containing protein n=1 Tax=Petrimonas sp. TaxID=2023866 RepID=UPI0017774FD4|nr:DUF4302 domain-containing protein [Petrimonas sp.]
MKKTYIFLLIALLAATSCRNEFDSVFDKTPAEREAESIKKWKDALISSPDGWLVHYYPNPEILGGFSFIMKFNDKGEVTMTWSVRDETKTSLYSVKVMEKPMLIFDTYTLLSKMTDPEMGNPGQGFGGENEFAFLSMSANGDTIYMQERQKADPFVLVKATAGDWENIKEYAGMEKILQRVGDDVVPYFYNLKVEGWGTTGVTMSYYEDMQRANLMYKANGKDTLVIMGVNMIHNGFQFRKPLTVNGVSVRTFIYDPATKTHKAVEAKGGFNYETKFMAEIKGMWSTFFAPGKFGGYSTYLSPAARLLFDVIPGNPVSFIKVDPYSTSDSHIAIIFENWSGLRLFCTFDKKTESETRIVFKDYDTSSWADYPYDEAKAIMESPKGQKAKDVLFSAKGWSIVPVYLAEYGSMCVFVSNEDPTVYVYF